MDPIALLRKHGPVLVAILLGTGTGTALISGQDRELARMVRETLLRVELILNNHMSLPAHGDIETRFAEINQELALLRLRVWRLERRVIDPEFEREKPF